MTTKLENDNFYSDHLNMLFYAIVILSIILFLFNLLKAFISYLIKCFSNLFNNPINISSKLSFILNEELNNEAIKLNYLNDHRIKHVDFHKPSIFSEATLMSKNSTSTFDKQKNLYRNTQLHDDSSIIELLNKVNQEKAELDYLIKQKSGKYNL